MARTYDVYGVGHALVDIQYQVAPEFLAEHQVEKGVMTLVDEARQHHLTAAVGGEPVASASGGSAANTLIGVARFGGRTYYACLTGRDAWGDFYQRDLEAAGVATHPANRGEGKTGQCLVFITPDADRTLNTFLGISSAIGPAQLQEEVIADSQYLYIEGYLLGSDDGFAAAVQAQHIAQRHNTAVALTLSDPFAVRAFQARFDALLQQGVDLLFCNGPRASYRHQRGRRSLCRRRALRAVPRVQPLRRGASGLLCGRASSNPLRAAPRTIARRSHRSHPIPLLNLVWRSA